MKPEQVNERAWELILARVRELRAQKATLEQIGEMCGATKATVQRWFSGAEGGEKTPFVNMLRYLKGLDISLDKILGESFTAPPSINGLVVNDKKGVGGFSDMGLTVLGVYAVAGAGPSFDASVAEPIFNIAVPAQFVRSAISVIFVAGSSMEPTILNNAVIGINREQTQIVQGDIYAVRLPYEGIVVKRIYLDHARKCFVLRSDNKKDENEFPDILIPFEEGEGDAFIYGKVSWVLQSYDK